MDAKSPIWYSWLSYTPPDNDVTPITPPVDVDDDAVIGVMAGGVGVAVVKLLVMVWPLVIGMGVLGVIGDIDDIGVDGTANGKGDDADDGDDNGAVEPRRDTATTTLPFVDDDNDDGVANGVTTVAWPPPPVPRLASWTNRDPSTIGGRLRDAFGDEDDDVDVDVDEAEAEVAAGGDDIPIALPWLCPWLLPGRLDVTGRGIFDAV